ncbi:NACHT domain-containing protein [Streptomyces sp. NPDC085929]|uniref:NACHT domain-containing protein n=1 Tax=Streptomyces sp. NPDC085929 TaxID=3365739 RepID=UPI0037D40D0F
MAQQDDSEAADDTTTATGRDALVLLRQLLERGRATHKLTKTQLVARTGLGKTTVIQAFSMSAPAPSAITVAKLADCLKLNRDRLLELHANITVMAPPPVAVVADGTGPAGAPHPDGTSPGGGGAGTGDTWTDEAAARIASQVLADETEHASRLLGPGGHRIDLSFRCVPELANNAAGAQERGNLREAQAFYLALRPARLVITGEPGAGKTLLAIHLVLALLSDRTRSRADPVPVRFSLAGWSPGLPLQRWLAEQVADRFAAEGVSRRRAVALVKCRRILPVLDGLDEMDAADTPLARSRAYQVLEELNSYQDARGSAPVVLTCRTELYERLTRHQVRMRDAARVRIEAVSAVEAVAYLTDRTAAPRRWQPVLSHLAESEPGVLATVLNTPWRLNLAATVYEQRDAELAYRRDPADLLAFTSAEEAGNYLLGHYLSAASALHPTAPDRYPVEATRRWLGVLAAGPATGAPKAGTDLYLHELWQLMPRRVRIAELLLVLLWFAILCAWVQLAEPKEPDTWTVYTVLLAGLLWLRAWKRRVVPRAAQLGRMGSVAGLRLMGRRIVGAGTAGFLIGFLAAVAVTLVWGVVDLVMLSLDPFKQLVLLVGCTAIFAGVSLPAGILFGVLSALTGPVTWERTSATPTNFGRWVRAEKWRKLTYGRSVGAIVEPRADPHHAIRHDLLVGFGLIPMMALSGGLVLTEVVQISLDSWTLTPGQVAVCLVLGLLLGLYLLTGAGRRYLVFLLCARGQLPWRLGRFLRWAYGAGLLRVSGSAYQFRHRELQEWLGAHGPRQPASTASDPGRGHTS